MAHWQAQAQGQGHGCIGLFVVGMAVFPPGTRVPDPSVHATVGIPGDIRESV